VICVSEQQAETKRQGETKPIVPFADFARLDLRVAKIVDVQPVEGATKLYKLTIRIGDEERTLAAGVAEHYAPDELMGKKIVVVANLEPKTVRGVTSQGMLLAAIEEADGKVSKISILSPDNAEVPDGSKVG